MEWHSMSIEETVKQLNTSLSRGLTSQEVIKRQKTYGLNRLEVKRGKNIFQKFIAQFKDFMIIILILAAFVSFLISFLEGQPNYVDPIIIFVIIILNATLGVMQESKAEKALDALKKMSAPTAHVLRNGKNEIVDSVDLVPGDIILLETGYFVPADARLVKGVNLKVEEASLTGESHPVDKYAEKRLPENTSLGDRINLVMSTTIVTYGRGIAIVTDTGMNTQVGHIAKLIMDDEPPMTPLQIKLAKTGKILGIAALVICVFIFTLGLMKNMPVFDMFMTSVGLAVAAIPEGLPAIVTIMLSIGVQRMAKKNAVIRKLPAVETLGSATVICSDKTGTLTQNVMTVTEICSIKGTESGKSEFGAYLLSHGALCCDATLQMDNGAVVATGEATEKAIILAAYHGNIVKSILDKSYPRISEIPFDSNRKLMTTVHNSPDHTYRSVTKGAYDFLINKCTHIYKDKGSHPMTTKDIGKLNLLNNTMTKKALRVIAVAYKNVARSSISNNPVEMEKGLTLIGLIGMIDPPREEVKEAVNLCKEAYIKPVMITGDHVLTAMAIGKELGILTDPSQAITGEELSRMDSDTLVKVIPKYTVFARVSPEHKVRIVKAYQNRGEVVAMTGDGVNDAPALKAANIGCAMGITGTDVAKNAADMILTDDNFATIVSAVKEGRGIYDNIKKAVHFLLSSNIGEILTIFVAMLFDLPMPLVAVQLLWVNLVTDSLPAISLGMEPAEKDIMKKKPIPQTKGLFADGLAFRIIVEGFMIGSLALAAFVIGYHFYDLTLGITIPYVGRTMAFAVLSLSQLFHSFNMRSEHSLSEVGLLGNPRLVASFFICSFLQVAVISLPPLAVVFQVVPLDIRQWAIVLLLSMAPIVIVEFQKKSNKSYNRKK